MKPPQPDPSSRKPDENKFIAYQTNKIPWYIYLMWAIFAVFGIIYLFRFALSDFHRWW